MAIGDNGDSYEDGRLFSQDPSLHLAKLVRIDPSNGATAIVGLGVRCVQRLVVSGSGTDARLSFTDPGGWVSEELNSVAVSELTGAQPLNFGWGRGVGGESREGTFYIDQAGNSTDKIQSPEAGIVEPAAEFGREGAKAVAVSGPVISATSFSRITALFADLVSGGVFAITGPLNVKRQPVYRVGLVAPDGKAITLKDLAGGERPDPRFFNFPDGRRHAARTNGRILPADRAEAWVMTLFTDPDARSVHWCTGGCADCRLHRSPARYRRSPATPSTPRCSNPRRPTQRDPLVHDHRSAPDVQQHALRFADRDRQQHPHRPREDRRRSASNSSSSTPRLESTAGHSHQRLRVAGT
jgi:hypothetical protein